MTRRPHLSSRAGLTLAELLVALFVSALALGICAEGVRRALSMHGALEVTRAERESFSAGLGAARERMERAVAVAAPGPDADSQRRALFHGTPEGLAFVAADPGYPSIAGLYEYRIAASSGDGEFSLMLMRRPFLDVAGFNEDGTELDSWPLASAGTAPRFHYAGPDGGWREDWREEPALPALVRITMDATSVIARLPAAPDQPETEPGDNGEGGQPAGETGERE
jgi:type II secretory pathway component PulJ